MNDVALKLASQQQQRDVRAEIAEIQRANTGMSQAEISRQSGVHSTRLNQYLKGTYPGDIAEAEAQLIRWIDAYTQRQAEARTLPKAPAFAITPTSDRILAALGYAQVANDIAVIYGGAGLGKTTSIKHYQSSNPNVWIATMTPATSSVGTALEEIAEAIGIEVSIGGSSARVQRAICKRLRGSFGLLIIDEAQHLGVQALDMIRSLHDATEIGLALVGNESVYARMTGGNRAAYLDRLFSRIGKRVRLNAATKKDVDALILAWGIKPGDCREVLHSIASKPGGLRGLTKTLRLASMLANGRGEGVCCEDIRAAWRDLGGEG